MSTRTMCAPALATGALGATAPAIADGATPDPHKVTVAGPLAWSAD